MSDDVKRMSEISRKVKKYAVEHYGNLVYVEEPRPDAYTDKYPVNLGVHYPRLI